MLCEFHTDAMCLQHHCLRASSSNWIPISFPKLSQLDGIGTDADADVKKLQYVAHMGVSWLLPKSKIHLYIAPPCAHSTHHRRVPDDDPTL